MSIDAVVANIDHVWSDVDRYRQSNDSTEQRDALRSLLQGIRDDGYPLLLISRLNAATLNDALTTMLGPDGPDYFSAILSSRPEGNPYALALHTLEVSPHRVMTLGSSESELQEARDFGIARCVLLREALGVSRAL